MSIYQSNDILEVKSVSKSFKDLEVIKDVNIALREKEFVSIIGPSGCGKSTLFNIISGLMNPCEGMVFLENTDITGLSGRISYMQQKDLLLPWKSIIDNVTLPLKIKGIDKAKRNEQVKNYFELFGLSGFEDSYPSQLSGGMKQRASLMRAYMFSNQVMLLDEPFAGLDEITKTKMHKWLLEINEKLKTSCLLITHDVNEAIFLSDRIYVLSERPGRIIKELKIDIDKNLENLETTVEFNSIKRKTIGFMEEFQ
jgi:ABC-type nitrate/sulfonate/bicarbonate transport system ATPase subunit